MTVIEKSPNWETDNRDSIQLPTKYFFRQVVSVQFRSDVRPMTATIKGIHFYEGKVKYDLGLWMENDSETRIYNVDSCFVCDQIIPNDWKEGQKCFL